MNLTWAIKEVFKILNLNSDIINVEKDSSNIMSFFYNIKKEQSLNDVMPNLAKEWDYEKNGDLLPTQVSCGSDKKVWWKCEKGHEWHARISSRVKGSGCPYCSGRYVVTGVNDLALLNINLTKEWNYEKNGDLLPSQVSCGSSKAVWWKCQKCGYEWKSRVSHRSKGVGCPVCSGHQVLTGYNDLSTLYPSVAQEWNYDKNGELLPMQVSCGSKKKVWWICNKGHEWKATVYSRTGKKHSGCPECAKERIGIANSLPKDGCSLLDLKPDLAKEWNYEKNGSLLPSQVSINSSKKVWWKCSKGHEWQSVISYRSRGSNCPICSNHQILSGYNDLETKHPELAKEWNYEKNGDLLPSKVSCGSNKRVWWKCKKGHEWQAIISSRSNGRGCPECAKEKIGIANSLPKDGCSFLDLKPDLAKEWNYEKNGSLLPNQVSYGSGKKVWWICSKGHEWQAYINNRNKGFGRCPECAKKKK